MDVHIDGRCYILGVEDSEGIYSLRKNLRILKTVRSMQAVCINYGGTSCRARRMARYVLFEPGADSVEVEFGGREPRSKPN
jgi:hypothetical protein